ncbi:MAG: S41 family peptidase [Persicimonas sp.]
MQGYYRHPTVFDSRVVFVSEDDLWEVPLEGGLVRRLTDVKGAASDPIFSPDGAQIAFTGTDQGTPEVYVMPSGGGEARQLTFNGAHKAVVGWSEDGAEVLFRSNCREPFARTMALYSVPADGGEPRRLEVGPAHAISHESGGSGRVIARYADDLARWKRYRGGTAGVLWIDRTGAGDWEQLLAETTAGLVRPMWIGERVYFITDTEGYGNLYSCTLEGDDLQRHTDHAGFYARFARTDGASIVYTVGGELWKLEVAADQASAITCEYASPRTQLSRKFVDAEEYVDGFELHPKGHSLAVTSRGKLFNFGNWEGAVRQTGREQGVRYRLARYLEDGQRLVVVSDEGGEDHLEIHRADGAGEPTIVEVDHTELGRPLELEVVAGADEPSVLLSNHRYELLHVALETGDVKLLDKSEYTRINGFSVSPEGRWVAYGFSNDFSTGPIRLYDLENDERHEVTSGAYLDVDPVFDPKGRYLYFLSYRDFNPVYDDVFFELSFPRAMKPCVVTLREEVDGPFVEKPRPLDDSSGSDNGSDGDDNEGEEDDDTFEIDLDWIDERVQVFPGREGSYGDLQATEKRVFWTVFPVRGSLRRDWLEDEKGKLEYFSLEDKESETFATAVSDFRIGRDHKTIALWGDEGLRVTSASGDGPAQSDSSDERPSRKSGLIDLDRLSIAVEPHREWEQMLREAWRLMRDHYWNDEMSGVDWEAVWERYRPLLDRVSTRSEFSDLVWTMQGELGTSHAYEMGGDYPSTPQHQPGFLAADVIWDPDVEFERGDQTLEGGYRIDHIVAAEAWEPKERSPLRRPGVDIAEGDAIVAINGKRVSEHVSVDQRLVDLAGEEVELTVVDAETHEVSTHTVETLRSEFPARYREWVVENRRRVHEATDGRVGYVHIPDMGPPGYSEFHRAFLSEKTKTGLIVDVRYNGGGHVSQLILEKLRREHLGYDVRRWGKPMSYPSDSVLGPMVALTNQHAGSDGDIFSHCFKLMGLGPLLGKRTWGGVIGIWPRHRLVDGSITTQPEFAFWFEDVGYGVENHGTDPDIEVELPPGADAAGEDPQLEAAIDQALALIEEQQPAVPDFGPPPDLAPPESLE